MSALWRKIKKGISVLARKKWLSFFAASCCEERRQLKKLVNLNFENVQKYVFPESLKQSGKEKI